MVDAVDIFWKNKHKTNGKSYFAIIIFIVTYIAVNWFYRIEIHIIYDVLIGSVCVIFAINGSSTVIQDDNYQK